MAEEKEPKEISRKRIALCQFCNPIHGGISEIVMEREKTSEEFEEARICNGVYASPTEQHTIIECDLGKEECAVLKAYRLAQRANQRDNSEPRYGG